MIRETKLEEINPFLQIIEYIVEDKIVAYLKYSLIYDRIEIDNLFVEENYRNQKIATKLMCYLLSIAIDKHVDNITLEVRKSNSVAIKLYKKMGFHEVAIRKYYYGDEDAILMEKEVM